MEPLNGPLDALGHILKQHASPPLRLVAAESGTGGSPASSIASKAAGVGGRGGHGPKAPQQEAGVGVRFIWTFGVIMQEWTIILTPGGLVVTVQRRGQNGYFALSIDGLVTMRRGSQDSTGGLDGRIGCNSWPPSSAKPGKHGKHGRAWQHPASSRCRRRHSTVCHVSFWASVSVTLCIRTLRGVMVAPRRGTAQGHYQGHYDQKRIDHDHDGHDGRGGENSGRTQGRGRDIR